MSSRRASERALKSNMICLASLPSLALLQSPISNGNQSESETTEAGTAPPSTSADPPPSTPPAQPLLLGSRPPLLLSSRLHRCQRSRPPLLLSSRFNRRQRNRRPPARTRRQKHRPGPPVRPPPNQRPKNRPSSCFSRIGWRRGRDRCLAVSILRPNLG